MHAAGRVSMPSRCCRPIPAPTSTCCWPARATRARDQLTMGLRADSPMIAVAAPTPEQVYAALRAGLEAGDVAPGGRLASERDLAAQFGVSRGAVRRALARLAGEGLIERRRGRAGSRARPLDLMPPRPDTTTPFASPQDVLEARLAVEPGFVDLVIARATEDDFARMAACLMRMEAARAPAGVPGSGVCLSPRDRARDPQPAPCPPLRGDHRGTGPRGLGQAASAERKAGAARGTGGGRNWRTLGSTSGPATHSPRDDRCRNTWRRWSGRSPGRTTSAPGERYPLALASLDHLRPNGRPRRPVEHQRMRRPRLR